MDIKDIWEALRDIFIVWDTDDDMDKHRYGNDLMVEKPSGTWTMLEEILDLTKKEFTDAARRRWKSESLDSDEDEEKREGEEDEKEDEEDEKDGNLDENKDGTI